jgi:DNA-binding NtrC family response regulator
LILGETGTGKELVARAIHDASPRAKGPFIAINCGAFPEHLVESELFGHEAGAFTGAQKRYRGKFELAHGGTLFLDELGEMPRSVQVKLLRFLQDSRFTPIGSETEKRSDVRILAATNKNIAASVASGELRSDLVFRLNVFTVDLPPLRDREADVIQLANAFAREVARRLERTAPVLTPAAEQALRAYGWPGNVRELRNVIERALILARDNVIDQDLLPQAPETRKVLVEPQREPAAAKPRDSVAQEPGVPGPNEPLRPFSEAKDEMVARFEAGYCEDLLRRASGNIARAARLAKIDKKNLHRKLRAYGIDARGFRPRDAIG